MLAYDEVDFESTTLENDEFSIKKSLKNTYDAFSTFIISYITPPWGGGGHGIGLVHQH